MNIDEFIFPNPQEKIIIIRAEKREELKGSRLSQDDPLYKLIMKEFDNSYHQSILRLNQCSRNLGNNARGPNVLYLSENEGCYPRTGIKIKNDKGYEHYPDLNYVDLVLDEARVEEGGLRIYSHENAHNMLSNLWPCYPEGESTMTHTGIGITDYYTAFNEGWAEHFERFTDDSIEKYEKMRRVRFKPRINFVKLWLSEFDRDIRYEGTLKNKHIYKKLLPEADITGLSIEEKILLEQVSPNFDTTRLKNAQEILSSEGVAACIFYAINIDETITNNYMPKEFYNAFLIKPLPENVDICEVFTPFENAILKNLWVINIIKDSHKKGTSPIIEFINSWCQAFPKDREQIIKIFINTTVAKTIENDTGRIYEKMALLGMMGRYHEFMELKDKYMMRIEETSKGILEGKLSLDFNVGPEIWLQNSKVNSPWLFWPTDERTPLKININTATQYQLMSFPKISEEKAREIINIRDEKGYICDISEIGEEYFSL